MIPLTVSPDSRATLGVLGGGQLGRLFVHAAQALGLRTVVLDPDSGSPAGAVAHDQVCCNYDDETAWGRLADVCAAVTTEFENVPAQALRWLAQRVRVAPPAAAVEICQDRLLEKAHFTQNGIDCAPFARIETAADAADDAVVAALLPGILKTARLGYDGRGQWSVDSVAALAHAWQASGCARCVLERRLPLSQEISVIVARGADGQLVHLPVQQNLHRDGILSLTQVPPPDIPPAVLQRAVEIANRLAVSLSYVGVLCIEFFVLPDQRLIANEMAPRPHNSGHYSIDACDVSQFDLQVRTLAGLPLVQPRQHSPAVMLNLLGDLWFSGLSGNEPATPNWAGVLELPGAHLHLYGKAVPRPGRKMGHLTVTASDFPTARSVALRAAALLGMPAF